MAIEKEFYRIQLSKDCKVDSKMVNGAILTKKWLVKTGSPKDFEKFPDVIIQKVVKQQDGSFAPTGKTLIEDKPIVEDAPPNKDRPDFEKMTMEQLKTFLITNGVTANELKTAIKPELVERADSLWSQKNS